MLTLRKLVYGGLLVSGFVVAGYYGHRWYSRYTTTKHRKDTKERNVALADDENYLQSAQKLEEKQFLSVNLEEILNNNVCNSSRNNCVVEESTAPLLDQDQDNEVSRPLADETWETDVVPEPIDQENLDDSCAVQQPSNEVIESESVVEDTSEPDVVPEPIDQENLDDSSAVQQPSNENPLNDVLPSLAGFYADGGFGLSQEGYNTVDSFSVSFLEQNQLNYVAPFFPDFYDVSSCDASQTSYTGDSTVYPLSFQYPSNYVMTPIPGMNDEDNTFIIPSLVNDVTTWLPGSHDTIDSDASQEGSTEDSLLDPSLSCNTLNDVTISLSGCTSYPTVTDLENIVAPPTLVQNPSNETPVLVCASELESANTFGQNTQLTVVADSHNGHNVQVMPEESHIDWISVLESQHPYKMYDPSNDYNTIKDIGEGSFGHVYLAKHKQIQEEFAIKKIPLGSTQNQTNIVNELEILRLSSHKNIIFLVESYLYDVSVHIVTEYVDGLSLSNICEIGPCCFSETAIASITKECLQGLAYLHERSYVHCDIKGSNILLSKDGKVKLIDFGLAIKTNSPVNAGVRGAFLWRAPEICNNIPYGNKVDIWSLGMVIMEMLQEHPPLYWIEDVNQMLALSKAGYTTMQQEVQEMVSNELQDFLYNGALIVDPNERWSALELLQHSFLVYGDDCECLPRIVRRAMQQQLLYKPI